MKPILIEQTQQADGWKEPAEVHVELSCAFDRSSWDRILNALPRVIRVRDDRWRFRQMLQGTE